MTTIKPFFEDEESLVREALNVPLDEKIEKAVETLKTYVPQEGFYLAYSGGKDSNVILELAKMSGVEYEAWYNITTLDPPELIWFMKENFPEVNFNHPDMTLLTRFAKYKSCGPPTRGIRWCCRYYKEKGGKNRLVVSGVRSQESSRRKNMWKTFVRTKNGDVLSPIIYWTEKDVWAFHKQRGIPHCSLYDEGFKRLGCIGCPLAGTKQQKIEFARWPQYEKLWQRAFKRFWENWSGKLRKDGETYAWERFGCWENHWNWWLNGGHQDSDKESDCQINMIFQ